MVQDQSLHLHTGALLSVTNSFRSFFPEALWQASGLSWKLPPSWAAGEGSGWDSLLLLCPIPELGEGLIPTEAQSLKEKLSAELAAAHKRIFLGNTRAWNHLCSVWLLLCTSNDLSCSAEPGQKGTAQTRLWHCWFPAFLLLGLIQVPLTELFFIQTYSLI